MERDLESRGSQFRSAPYHYATKTTLLSIVMLMGGMSGSRSSSKLEDNDMKGDDGKVQPGKPFESVSTTVQQLKKQILTNRFLYVKEKLDGNRRITGQFSNELLVLSKSRFDVTTGRTEVKNPLTVRMESSLCKLGGLCLLGGENDEINCHEEGSNTSSTIIFGSSLGGRSVIRPIKIPHVQKIPPYTTWIFLDRNQIMADDQSVVGRRRIYYDQNGSEALICSDSEEDPLDEEDEKYDFSEGDDDMLRNVISQHGLTDTVLNSLSQCLEVKATEIQTRYEFLQQQQQQKGLEHTPDEASVDYSISDIFTGKDLDTAMDSFDNLFCRRCLVFDCRLHGCSQPFVFPCEKQLPWSPPEEESRLPCGSNCYRLVESLNADETNCKNSFGGLSEETPTSCGNIEGSKVLSHRKGLSHNDLKSEKNVQLESACSNEKQATEACHANVVVKWEGNDRQSKSCSNGKQGKKVKENSNKTNKRNAEQVLASMRKRQKKIASDVGSSVSGGITPVDGRRNSRKSTSKMTIKKKNRDSVSSKKSLEEENSESNEHKWRDSNEVEYDKQMENDCDMLQSEEVSSCKMELATEDPKVEQNAWSSIEKSLYTKGVQIFGKNSCLIARNLLYGLKTCSEVAEYMDHNGFGNQGTVEIGTSSRTESSTKGTEVRARTRFWRRRGRVRRLKYTWKSTGHPAIRKRIADSKDLTCRQYTPCDCQSTCGKQCPCLRSGTCCEKYCGCPKVCKNRFRGCHCAKSQCRSRQCPCFAAGRECDPDVCRNCWVGCGDGTLGGPPQRGDNYECRNMKLLLKQQQRVLLGRSDVSGWGAFLKNSVNKHDYLGEYTGELISHREADKRGKIYDRENSSFLFNLNDQYVLDAYRKGDKLKFANHSPTPNCYAKVIMVAGDHRVGIFAKERICGGEELFYDYRYEPDKAPAWARKAEDSNIKRDDTSVSHGRAQKVAR